MKHFVQMWHKAAWMGPVGIQSLCLDQQIILNCHCFRRSLFTLLFLPPPVPLLFGNCFWCKCTYVRKAFMNIFQHSEFVIVNRTSNSQLARQARRILFSIPNTISRTTKEFYRFFWKPVPTFFGDIVLPRFLWKFLEFSSIIFGSVK